jgi:D-3-phosphoglycerate dehydrogenase
MEWEEDFDRLLARVDILSIHLALTPQTRGIVGERQFRLMKPGAIVVNTSRGKLIDEAAMIAALQDGRLAGAGLDNFAVEPPDPRNPLFSFPNVIVTPHVAGATTGAADRMAEIGASNIICYLRGETYDPANFVNPEVFGSRRPGTGDRRPETRD